MVQGIKRKTRWSNIKKAGSRHKYCLTYPAESTFPGEATSRLKGQCHQNCIQNSNKLTDAKSFQSLSCNSTTFQSLLEKSKNRVEIGQQQGSPEILICPSGMSCVYYDYRCGNLPPWSAVLQQPGVSHFLEDVNYSFMSGTPLGSLYGRAEFLKSSGLIGPL